MAMQRHPVWRSVGTFLALCMSLSVLGSYMLIFAMAGTLAQTLRKLSFTLKTRAPALSRWFHMQQSTLQEFLLTQDLTPNGSKSKSDIG
jgi:hypothetical protein